MTLKGITDDFERYSGRAGFYLPEELMGKQYVVVLQGCHETVKLQKMKKLENGPNFECRLKKLTRHSLFSILAEKAEFSWNMKLLVF